MNEAAHPTIAELRAAVNPAARQPILNALVARGVLAHADLSHADLSGADLAQASLHGANFQHANLSGANLTDADLSQAGLRWANLSRAHLCEADCSCAFLWEVALHGAHLRGANFVGASLIGTHFETNEWQPGWIVLPDGTHWTADADLRRFTDPRHPRYEASIAAANLMRLRRGLALLPMHDCAHRLFYPLPGERLTRQAMRARLNQA